MKTLVPSLAAMLDASSGESWAKRLGHRVAKIAERLENRVVAQPGPELRLSLIAITSPELATLRTESPGALYLWTVLRSQADGKTGESRVTVGRMCKLLGAPRSSVGHWLRVLERGGWLQRRYQMRVHRTATEYWGLITTPMLPQAVASREQAAMERGQRMEAGDGDDDVSKNRAGVVYLRRAIIPLQTLTSQPVAAASASGHEFVAWLYLQAQTWARGLRMTSRWIARDLHLLSREIDGDKVREGGAKVRVALAALRRLGLVHAVGDKYEPKVWSTPETLGLPVSDRRDRSELDTVSRALPESDSNPYVERVLKEWLDHCAHKGTIDQRRSAGPTAGERELATMMVAALDPLADPFPNDPDPAWLDPFFRWLQASWHAWRGPKPYMLDALTRANPPDWLPI